MGCSLQAARKGFGARPVCSASVFGNGVGFDSSRVPTRLTIRSSRRRFVASLKLAAMRAILALHCCGRRGLTLALGGNQASRYAYSMKVSEILRLLQDDGWFLVATRGSHRQYKHSTKSGRVTVPGKPSDDLAPGTLNSILKQADLKR